jgi:hypothetical protein
MTPAVIIGLVGWCLGWIVRGIVEAGRGARWDRER